MYIVLVRSGTLSMNIAFVLIEFPPLGVKATAFLKRYRQAKELEATCTETRETPSRCTRRQTEVGRNYRRDFIALFKNKLLTLLTGVTVAQLHIGPSSIVHDLHTEISVVLQGELAQAVCPPILLLVVEVAVGIDHVGIQRRRQDGKALLSTVYFLHAHNMDLIIVIFL